MKKTIAILLVLVICVSLGACGSDKEAVKNALQGSWTSKWTNQGTQISRYYTFKGNTYTKEVLHFLESWKQKREHLKSWIPAFA